MKLVAMGYLWSQVLLPNLVLISWALQFDTVGRLAVVVRSERERLTLQVLHVELARPLSVSTHMYMYMHVHTYMYMHAFSSYGNIL